MEADLFNKLYCASFQRNASALRPNRSEAIITAEILWQLYSDNSFQALGVQVLFSVWKYMHAISEYILPLHFSNTLSLQEPSTTLFVESFLPEIHQNL